MGTSKSEHFSEEQNKVAAMMKALGHPARIAILEFLLAADSCIGGDIVKELPLAQPTVSQHLKEMKKAGLIKGTIEGTATCYCIDETALAFLSGYLGDHSARLSQAKTNCC